MEGQSSRTLWTLVACAVLTALSAPVRAQDGPGTTGAAVLDLLAGARAAGLSGAYTSASGDPDVMFYNPAGIASLSLAAAASYQRHVLDIGLMSGSAAAGVGPVTLGAAVAFLDYGEIQEIVPDPNVGGQNGTPTGNMLGSAELAVRAGAALALMNDRLRLGAAAGFVSVGLAGIGRSAPIADLGAQYVFSQLTLGAAIRNLGGSLSGDFIGDSRVPSEARLGATYDYQRSERTGAVITADLVHRLKEGGGGLVLGIEAGLRPTPVERFGAVARLGYDASAGGDAIGALQLGAGLALGEFALDYAFQNFDFFGAIHRLGLRWALPR